GLDGRAVRGEISAAATTSGGRARRRHGGRGAHIIKQLGACARKRAGGARSLAERMRGGVGGRRRR
ncbi:hypothetical protein ACX84Q_21460, partial [Burkholderia pseudomallei]